jgi:capsular polysaccharide biosynthesis protein/GGDEF domain-containing protein
MELRAYINILLKRWWALLLGFTVVVSATWIWTNQQERIYQSKATFVLRPRSSTLVVDDDFVKALDMVSRRVEINTTFAEVATSRLIKSEARSKVESGDTAGMSVSASVLSGTNILTIIVEGSDPVTTQEFCALIGAETLNYVSELYDVFELQPLDPASLSRTPVSPNLSLNLLIGSVLGLTVGVGLAFLIEFIRSPYEEPGTFNIIDRETGAYNKSYFTLRLHQEMNRAKRNKYPLSLGLIKVEFDGEDISTHEWIEAMRVFKKLSESSMREDDILARVNGDIFAILFPYVKNDKAEELIAGMKQKFTALAQDILSNNGGGQVICYSSVVTYQGGFINGSRLLEKGIEALSPGDDHKTAKT